MQQQDHSAFESFQSSSLDAEAEHFGVIQISPATDLITIDADPRGGVFYQVGHRSPRIFLLGLGFVDARLAVIDTTRAMWILDPTMNNLRAVCCFVQGQPRLFLFGGLWGVWIDETGKRYKTQNPVSLIKTSGSPGEFNAKGNQITFGFNINPSVREAYSEDTMKNLSHNAKGHQIELTFEVPSGNFSRAQVNVNNTSAGGRSWSFGLKEFPLVWPKRPEIKRTHSEAGATAFVMSSKRRAMLRSEPAYEETGGTNGTGKDHKLTDTGSQRVKLKPRGPEPEESESRDASQTSEGNRARMRPSSSSVRPSSFERFSPPEKPAGGPRETSFLSTQHLSTMDLFKKVDAEEDAELRWKIIETNLILGRPERTYSLVSRYPEIISQRTPEWPPARLKTVFDLLDADLLIGVMEKWYVNQVLSLLEGNPDEEKLLHWLEYRELERMLELPVDHEVTSAAEARRALCVDRNADAQDAKKVWRMLLKFLNPDLGRQHEQEIHRHKDEIAKHLQEARNVLMRRG